MASIDEILAAYDRWCDLRARYSESDCTPDGPSATEWHDSDDEAVELLHALAEAVRAPLP